jgi:hypothetical protein
MEKNIGGPNCVERANHFVARSCQYSLLSMRKGGMKVLRPYSFGVPSDFSLRIASSLVKYGFVLVTEKLY